MPAVAVTWRDKLRYRFENTLSKGTVAIIGWLALLSLGIVVLASLILAVMRVGQDPADHEHPYGFFEGMWQSHAAHPRSRRGRGDSGWQLRLLMLIVTIGGIFIVSILIGTITSGPRIAAHGAAQGPLACHRKRLHADPRLVEQGVLHHRRAADRQRKPEAAVHRDPVGARQGRDGR